MTLQQFNLLSRLVLDPIKASGARVYIFGSRARGEQHPHSDVDLLLEGEVSDHLIGRIREDIEESMFPFSVELVRAEQLAESYRSSVYKDRVEI